MSKLLIFAAPVLLGGAYFAGIFGTHYSRDVDRTPEQVERALAGYDLPDQPNTGTPNVSLDAKPNEMIWTVMSGDKVAVRLIADLVPLDGGKRTRITTHSERGDAPEELVSPAFRSTRLATSMFSAGLDTQLDRYLAPRGDPKHCQDLADEAREQNSGHPPLATPGSFGQLVGATASLATRASAYDTKMRAEGCDMQGNALGDVADSDASKPDQQVSFRAGEPMIDVSHH